MSNITVLSITRDGHANVTIDNIPVQLRFELEIKSAYVDNPHGLISLAIELRGEDRLLLEAAIADHMCCAPAPDAGKGGGEVEYAYVDGPHNRVRVNLGKSSPPISDPDATKREAWVIANGNQDLFRTFSNFNFSWTKNINEAIWYARREDAERVHADDEDAWAVVTVAAIRARPASAPVARPEVIETLDTFSWTHD